MNNIDLEIQQGEFVAITGASGSGKTTLLYLLAGLEKPTDGEIFFKGHALHRMGEKEAAEFRLSYIGFVRQSFNLMPALTILENAALPLACQGVGLQKRTQKAKELLISMGLEKHFSSRPGELSGMLEQKAAIAKAFIAKPDIVFADEPTGNLDSTASEEILQTLCDTAKKNGAALILATHDIEKAKYAERCVHLVDGQISTRAERGNER